MIKRLDYNSIKWGDYLYLDPNSKSGLKWKIEQRSGKNYNVILVKAHSDAGSIRIDKGGRNWWEISLKGINYKAHRIVYILLYGSINDSLLVDHLNGDSLDNIPSNLELKTSRGNGQNKKMQNNNTSGVVGVSFQSKQKKDGTTCDSWSAYWTNLEGKRCCKYFPVSEHGHQQSKYLASEYRNKQIMLLNEQGEQYTARHMAGGLVSDTAA